MRRYRRVMAVVFGLVVVVAPTAAAAPPPARAGIVLVMGAFQSYTPRAVAVTYDQRVPVDATVLVFGLFGPHGTAVSLAPKGLVAHREYGAHVHTKACGPAPADSGPHYQNSVPPGGGRIENVVDPRQPSTDPAFANSDNEIWLDFSTDAAGNAFTMTTVDWSFTDRRAHSVVIHEHHTHTGDGHAGTAGARLACINVNF